MNYITESKYFFIKTFGCQMNFYDSSLYEDYLLENGFKKAENIEDASILLVNTCAVREKSVSKVISFLGQVKKLNTNNKRLIVYLLGCMSPIYAD
ncbi:MAG: tRNA (N6-isopentenyl adenosine(37)-C2)-methylthiotransferase MiaB, partial [Caldisericia bacterium]|nr:tRNA (N6-isopentenyl adenosine(37)-C2)-methylthiotransferase MiaB [Caldisericia bacterium]